MALTTKELLVWTASKLRLTYARDLTSHEQFLEHEDGKLFRDKEHVAGVRPPPTGGYANGLWEGHFGDHGWGLTNRLLTLLGTMGGLGYGLWTVLSDFGGMSLGDGAVTVLKWTGGGALAGMFFTFGLIAAACMLLLYGILLGLGLLLNVLAG